MLLPQALSLSGHNTDTERKTTGIKPGAQNDWFSLRLQNNPCDFSPALREAP